MNKERQKRGIINIGVPLLGLGNSLECLYLSAFTGIFTAGVWYGFMSIPYIKQYFGENMELAPFILRLGISVISFLIIFFTGRLLGWIMIKHSRNNYDNYDCCRWTYSIGEVELSWSIEGEPIDGFGNRLLETGTPIAEVITDKVFNGGTILILNIIVGGITAWLVFEGMGWGLMFLSGMFICYFPMVWWSSEMIFLSKVWNICRKGPKIQNQTSKKNLE